MVGRVEASGLQVNVVRQVLTGEVFQITEYIHRMYHILPPAPPMLESLPRYRKKQARCLSPLLPRRVTYTAQIWTRYQDSRSGPRASYLRIQQLYGTATQWSTAA
jgi:hypothetical protein